jgi:hypothetical protein
MGNLSRGSAVAIRRHGYRRASGNVVAEFPAALFLFLIFLLFPLIDLATITLRATTVYVAAFSAARAAGRAETFESDTFGGKLSAINIARQEVVRTKQAGALGVTMSNPDVHVSIVGSPLQESLPAIRQQQKLSPNVSISDYLFQVEVTVVGRVEPLVKLNAGLFGNVPGLSAPLIITASFREFCEHPGGLTG